MDAPIFLVVVAVLLAFFALRAVMGEQVGNQAEAMGQIVGSLLWPGVCNSQQLFYWLRRNTA